MFALFLHLFLVLYLTASPSLAQVVQAQRSVPVKYATPGGTATGEVLKEDDNELQLNVTPCDAERTVVIFRQPYAKNSAGTIQCRGVQKRLMQAIQR